MILASIFLVCLSAAQFCGCGMPMFGGWGPMGYMGGGGGGQAAGYGQNRMANAYGAGNNNMQYGQGTGAVNANNARCNVNAMQMGGMNNYARRNANQVLVNSINDNSVSGTNNYGVANVNAFAGNNNCYGSGAYGGATNNYRNAAGLSNFNNGGYGSTGGGGGGMWGF